MKPDGVFCIHLLVYITTLGVTNRGRVDPEQLNVITVKTVRRHPQGESQLNVQG